MSERDLQFIDYGKQTIIDSIVQHINRGFTQYYLAPFNQLAKDIEREINTGQKDITFSPYELENTSNEQEIQNNNSVLVIMDDDAEYISDMLLRCVRFEKIKIIAPVSTRYFNKKPLFIVSIPKSGTHLLHKLISEFGYKAGGELTYSPQPGTWYCLEYSNSHTSARDFFIDTVRRSPFGNRDHPFTTTPAIMIYRNPLDILVSEANYYHKEGATIYSGYLQQLSFGDRLERLIDDPWLLGSIRDRVGNFIAYLDFPNVLPVSFEELVGVSGGGDQQQQQNLIWSLQLKLHIPGDPEKYVDNIFDKDSPTFNAGKIGQHLDCFEERHFTRFNKLDQDFMKNLGYEYIDETISNYIPKRAKEFQERPLLLADINFSDTPILIESGYMNFNIVKFNRNYYAIPTSIGEIDISSLTKQQMEALPQADALGELKQCLMLGSEYPKLIRMWQKKRINLVINNPESKKSTAHPYNILSRIMWAIWSVVK
jgi:hypothetical protein